MSVESTRAVMQRYARARHGSTSLLAEDVVFTIIATGQVNCGRAGVMAMLNYLYHIAFDAKAQTQNTIIADNQAVIEADFVGKHIGEFAGLLATGKTVRVPLCVVYDLEADQIKRARVYFEIPALFAQLGRPFGAGQELAEQS